MKNMQLNKDIRLDLISIDAGTQQRPLDDEVLKHYLNLMQDGVEFSPVEVVSDGPNFWLVDGFHRYRCAQERGQKSISAYVTKGTLRDAIWLSFGANTTHGLPRQKGVAKNIIEHILTDKSWSKKSLTSIAKHVGVTKGYVSQVKDALSAHGFSTKPIDEEKPPSETKNEGAAPTTEPDLQRDEEIEVERGGTKYEQKSQEKEHKADEPPKDAVGRVLPERLRELYEGRTVIKEYLSELSRVKDGVMKRIEMRDPAFSLLNITAFQVNYGNLRRTLKSALPYAVCCYCGGEDSKNCKACQGFGLLNKDSYEAAPKDLKL